MNRSLLACALMLTASAGVAFSATQPESEWWPDNWLNTARADRARHRLRRSTPSIDGTLKLTAQLYPLADGVDRDVTLQTRPENGRATSWTTRSRGQPSTRPRTAGPRPNDKRWLAHFRVDGLGSTRAITTTASSLPAARRPSRA
jgi:hypothetical protein